MPKAYDVVSRPGDMVLSRSSSGLTVYAHPDASQVLTHVRGDVVGFVVSTHVTKGLAYVLWSHPGVVGWCFEGWLRRLDQRG